VPHLPGRCWFAPTRWGLAQLPAGQRGSPGLAHVTCLAPGRLYSSSTWAKDALWLNALSVWCL
jgi:hypothetical protein